MLTALRRAIDFGAKTALVFGNEKNGISPMMSQVVFDRINRNMPVLASAVASVRRMAASVISSSTLLVAAACAVASGLGVLLGGKLQAACGRAVSR